MALGDLSNSKERGVYLRVTVCALTCVWYITSHKRDDDVRWAPQLADSSLTGNSSLLLNLQGVENLLCATIPRDSICHLSEEIVSSRFWGVCTHSDSVHAQHQESTEIRHL